ncbi:hypothetical protein HOO65_050738 [Ceratocystis lukuohia]|uniref:Xylanolytic transcriptional activator regulatory domain-containing protein n=1 Tax=Ceratocystis lukuohia TaxID=2019550 RepID=A0ABR4MH68_9PEZI
MDIKFVASDTSGLPVKRRQVSQACANCRKRKKRCIHTDDALVADDSPSPKRHCLPLSVLSNAATAAAAAAAATTTKGKTVAPRPTNNASPRSNSYSNASSTRLISSPPRRPTTARVSPPAPTPDEARRAGRFVGDLNPEAMFVEAAAASVPPQKYQVGLWLSSASHRGSDGGTSSSGVRGAGSNAHDDPADPGSSGARRGSRNGGIAGSTADNSGSLGENACDSMLHARPGNLLDKFFLPFIYRECLPCLPPPRQFAALRSLFLRRIHPLFPVIPETSLFSEATDAGTIVLKQAICVAAATHPAMSPHFVLANRGADCVLSFHEFTSTLCTAAQATLQSTVIGDRFVQIRAYLMLSLYAQPSSVDEMDLPAVLLGLAMHHTHTLGLQVRDDADAEMIQLYCALWALDKLNAAIYGRPSLVQDHDMSVNITDWISQCPPCFRLLLMIVDWLNKVIELYRPGPSKEASDYEKISSVDLPVLEKLILEADALKVQPTLLEYRAATIEILYHAVIIVSCRLPRPGGITTTRSIPPPSANARRSLAAERISSAISRYSITPIIFVPYAISLSLSVEYRKMRHTRLPMFRARSLAAFRYNCALLKQYADRFWNARILAGLGESVIREMDRVAPDGAEIEAAMMEKEKDVSEPQAHQPTQLQPHLPSQSNVQLQNHQQGSTPPFPLPPPLQPQSMPTLPPLQLQGLQSSSITNNSPSLVLGPVELAEPDSAQFDLDIWNSFGPDFNLDAVDSALEANLDVALPIKWDWMPDVA